MVKEVPAEVLMQRLQEFIKLWQKYMELFNQGLENEAVDPDLEAEFRKLMIDITHRAQFLSVAIPDGIFDVWKDCKKLVGETPSIELLRTEVPIRISAFRNMWHEVSISLNQKVGHLRNALEQRLGGKAKKR